MIKKKKKIPESNKNNKSGSKAQNDTDNRNVDDFIFAWGNPRLVVFYQKLVIYTLIPVIIAMSILLIVLSTKVNEVTPLPIYIDREAGTARCVDYKVVDALGKERSPAEIKGFIEQFLLDFYTFNKFTIKSNLQKALVNCHQLVKDRAKELLKESKRIENLGSGRQGICEIGSILIMETKPDIKVQVMFSAKLLDGLGQLYSLINKRAVFRLKTIERNRAHAYGLYIIEYRETKEKI